MSEVLYESLSDYDDQVEFDAYPGCCGIDIAVGFDMTPHNQYSDGKGITADKWHKQAYKRLLGNREARHIQLSLVTKYKNDPGKKEQAPGFKDFLLGKNWYIIDEFVNPNHGNTVCVMGKTFPKKKEKKVAVNNFYRW